MKKASGLFLRGGSWRSLDLQRRSAEGFNVKARRAKIFQVVDDPRVLARGHLDHGGNQEPLARSLSLGDLPQQQFEKDSLRSRAAIQQDESLIPLENEVAIANESQKTEPLGLRVVSGNLGPRRKRLLLQGDDSLWRLRKKGRGYSRRRGACTMFLRPSQNAARRIEDSTPDRLRLSQSHLTLRWMDVAIDKPRVQLDMQNADGMLAALKSARVGLMKRLAGPRGNESDAR